MEEEDMFPLQFLPDDELFELFGRITSLRTRFRLAGVNKRFRHFMLKYIAKPQSLQLDFCNQRINGELLHAARWPEALEALAEKTKFTQMQMYGSCTHVTNEVLAVFVDLPKSLESLKRFECDHITKTDFPFLKNLLATCPHLSILKIRAAPSVRITRFSANRRLDTFLTGKALTEVDLDFPCTQQQLEAFLKSLQPNTLINVALHLKAMGNWNLARLVQVLTDAWSGLETLSLALWRENAVSKTLFEKLGLLRSLKKCSLNIRPFDMEASEFIVQSVVVFLKKGPEGCSLALNNCGFASVTCHMSLISRVQTLLPGAQFSTQVHGWSSDTLGGCMKFDLEFTFGAVSFKIGGLFCRASCVCLECVTFYPAVVCALTKVAVKGRSARMHNFCVDKDNLGKLLEDFNKGEHTPRAVSAAVNDAQGMATVAFVKEDGEVFDVSAKLM